MPRSFNSPTTRIQTIRVTGATSAGGPTKIHKIPRSSAVKLYPTSAGTAAIYSTQTPQKISDLDTTNANITGSTNASWDLAGSVSAKTVLVVTAPAETIALVVASGTWVLEITTS